MAGVTIAPCVSLEDISITPEKLMAMEDLPEVTGPLESSHIPILDFQNPFISKEDKTGFIGKLASGTIPAEMFGLHQGNVLGLLKEKGVATTYNYSVTVLIPTSNGEVYSTNIYYNISTLTPPKLGYSFSTGRENDYRTLAQLSDLATVQFSYWDYGDLLITKFFNWIYRDQLDELWALKIGFNNRTLILYDNNRKLTLYNCAFERPQLGQCSFNSGLKQFEVTVAFEDYQEDFI